MSTAFVIFSSVEWGDGCACF